MGRVRGGTPSVVAVNEVQVSRGVVIRRSWGGRVMSERGRLRVRAVEHVEIIVLPCGVCG